MVSRQTDKNSSETRVYKYALRCYAPLPEEAIKELWRANALWNRLVEIDRITQSRWQQAYQDVSPKIKELNHDLDALNDTISTAYRHLKTIRMHEQTRSSKASPEIKDAEQTIAELKAKRSSLNAEIKKAKASVKDLIDATALTKIYRDEIRKACQVKQCQIYSQTADEIARDFATAREKALKTPRAKLQKHRFDGTGYFNFRFREKGAKKDGVRFQNLFVGNKPSEKRFEFTGRWPHGKKERLGLRATLAGGAKKQNKIVHDFIVTYHRPIPDDGIVQNGKIVRRRIGDRFELYLVLTVKTPLKEDKPTSFDKAIGIDIGFREVSNQLRVAVLASTDPNEHPQDILVPEVKPTLDNKRKSNFSKYEHMERLRSSLDQSANDLDQQLRPVLKANPLDEDHEKYKLWKSAAKLPPHVTLSFETAYKLARWILHCRDHKAKDMGLTKDAELLIMKWWRQNSRKYREMHNLRAKILDHRKHFYRNIAADLVERGLPIIVEKDFLAQIAAVKTKSTELTDKARGQRFIAAPSELIGAIENAAQREGLPFIKVNPRNTSKTCFPCGHVNKNLKSETTWKCGHCGAMHDRDENAARNIAALGLKQLRSQQHKKT